MARTGQVRIGISGWTYPPWRKTFYPDKLAQKDELGYASTIFRSIEINGTFYSLQKPESFDKWAAATPEDFVFSVKAPKYITHIQRLKEVDSPVSNFLASGLLKLGPKLGPIFWQLPPYLKFDAARIEAFLKLLPHSTGEAASVAKRHDKWMEKRAWTKVAEDQPLRHSLEVRHESFRVPEFVDLLRKYDVAIVCADTNEWPRMMDVTSDFLYVRMHGPEALYEDGYDGKTLNRWADRVATWARGKEPEDAERVTGKAGGKSKPRDVFVYFDIDKKVLSPANAQEMMKRVDDVLKIA